MSSWWPLLQEQSFTKEEAYLVKRFLKKPKSTGFLRIVSILKQRGYPQESFELLTYGVYHNPKYPAARVLLAKELFARGLIQEAAEHLQQVKNQIKDNVLGQNILFKITILKGHDTSARAQWEQMQKNRRSEDPVAVIGRQLQLRGILAAQNHILTDFADAGITPMIPGDLAATGTHPTSGYSIAPLHRQPMPLDDTAWQDPALKQFVTRPLAEVFRQNFEPSIPPAQENTDSTPASETLAEIYCKQGYYRQSLNVYQKLLRQTPSNDYLRRRVAELTQTLADEAAPSQPQVVAGVPTKNSDFYQQLLAKLS